MLAFANSWDTTPIGTESNILALPLTLNYLIMEESDMRPRMAKKWPTRRMRVLGKGVPGGATACSFSSPLQYSTQTLASPALTPASLRLADKFCLNKSKVGGKKGNRGCQMLSRRRQPWAFLAKLRSLLWMEKERECFALCAPCCDVVAPIIG